MRITKAEIFRWNVVQYPVGIRIYTDEGIYGDGEAALSYGRASNAAFGILKDLLPLVIGRDPLDNKAIWEELMHTTFWCLNGGPVTYAGMSAIDCALWDIKGKALRLPVYKLLGGKLRNSLRCYASQLHAGWNFEKYGTLVPKTPEEYGEVAKRAVNDGYETIKLDFLANDSSGNPIPFAERLGLLKPQYLHMLEERVAAVREAVGSHINIMMECHGNTDTNTALQILRCVEKYEISCIEEPNFPFFRTTKELCDKTAVAVSQGERLYGRWQFIPFLENGSVRLIQPDLGNCGGLTEGMIIADMAAAYDVVVQCHICATPLSINPALHLESVIPNFAIHEVHRIMNVYASQKHQLTTSVIMPKDGYIVVPEQEGMGNSWSEYALSSYTDYALIG